MHAHATSAEEVVAAQAIAGEPLDVDDRIVPAAVFTDPEITTVGMTESEAAAARVDLVVGVVPFRSTGRAMTTGRSVGVVRLAAVEGSGALLVAQIVGPDASELAFATGQRSTIAVLAETIHVHPTLGASVMEAAENALGRAIHTTI